MQFEVAVQPTTTPISGGQKAADLPPKVRIGKQLEELLEKLEVSNVFEAAAGTIVGLPRKTTDPKGRKENYFRVDLQQDPQPGKPLNIQYQVSTSTLACVLVDREVKKFGVSQIQDGLRKSLASGSYPIKGGGTPLYIYSVRVIEKKDGEKGEEATSSSPNPTKAEGKKAQKEAEEERRMRLLASLGQKQKPTGKDGKRN